MTALTLTPQQRRELRAQAHHLNPIVLVGEQGLSANVNKEINLALDVHGLIKIRVFNDDRAQREALFQELAHAMRAAPVQHIGKLLVLWRQPKEKEPTKFINTKLIPKDYKIIKNSRRGGQLPEVKTIRVLGNERITAGGKVKRARPTKATSIKKSQRS